MTMTYRAAGGISSVRRSVNAVGLRLAVLAGLVLVWQLVTVQSTSPFWPTPTEIASNFGTLIDDGRFGTLTSSLRAFAIGWTLAVVIGVLVGFLIGTNRVLALMFEPMIHFGRSIPPPVVIPAFIVVLGITAKMEISLIVFGTLWPIVMNTLMGARAVDPTMLEVADSYGVSRWRRALHVTLPATLPQVFVGLKISLPLGIVLTVLSELVAGSSGIGYELVNAQNGFRLTDMWCFIVVIALPGYAFNMLLAGLERRVLAWYFLERMTHE